MHWVRQESSPQAEEIVWRQFSLINTHTCTEQVSLLAEWVLSGLWSLMLINGIPRMTGDGYYPSLPREHARVQQKPQPTIYLATSLKRNQLFHLFQQFINLQVDQEVVRFPSAHMPIKWYPQNSRFRSGDYSWKVHQGCLFFSNDTFMAETCIWPAWLNPSNVTSCDTLIPGDYCNQGVCIDTHNGQFFYLSGITSRWVAFDLWGLIVLLTRLSSMCHTEGDDQRD